VSEQEKGSSRGSSIIDGYGDDNSLDRLQEWDNNLQTNAHNESLRDSFVDLLNYSAIAIMVLDKNWPELPDDTH